MKEYDAIIIGAGPAGLSAGIYLARAKQRVLIVDQATVGGQVILTHAVANYPGVGEISGYQLVSTMRKQAESFGCTILSNSPVTKFNFRDKVKQIIVKGESYQSKVIILAVGGDPRTLGLESETRLRGKGISYCATCDGDFFTNQEIVVVGGGNSALEEAVSLTKYASKVTIIHQFDHFQAYPYAIEEARANPKINFIMESLVDDFIGEDTLEAVRIKSKKDGNLTTIPATGAFIFIGYVPKTQPFADCVELTTGGEIVVDENMATRVSGVFAAGDARKKRYRQITTAVSDGTIAALSALEYMAVWKKEE
jgi:thioredoxin reductase (NADPH)